MKRIMKVLTTFGLCLSLVSCGWGFVACNKKTAPEFIQYYLTGSFSSPSLAAVGVTEWASNYNKDFPPPSAVCFDNTGGVCTLTIDLYKNDKFNIAFYDREQTGTVDDVRIITDVYSAPALSFYKIGIASYVKVQESARYTLCFNESESQLSYAIVGDVDTDVVVNGGIVLNQTSITLDGANNTFALKATVYPVGSGGKVSYNSSDPDVATVNSNGIITAVYPGTATVTATCDGKSATCKVNVEYPYFIVGSFNGAEDWIERADYSEMPSGRVFTKNGYVYELKNITLLKGDKFKIITLGAYAFTDAIGSESVDVSSQTYIGGGENIEIVESGVYTVTLDFNGVKPVVRLKKTQYIAEVEIYGVLVELWGAAAVRKPTYLETGWEHGYDQATAGYDISEDKFVATMDIHLYLGEFQFRYWMITEDGYGRTTYYSTDYPTATDFSDTNGLLTERVSADDPNYRCNQEGLYRFTVTFDLFGTLESVTAEISDIY